MRCVLVSMDSTGGITAGFVYPGLCRRSDRGVIVARSFWNCVDKMLAEAFQRARLETRTEESNMYASWWVVNP